MAKKNLEAFSEDEITAMLKEAQEVSFKKTDSKVEVKVPSPQVKLDAKSKEGTGYGVIKNDNKYAIVELTFNLATNTAKIEGIVETSSNKTVAGVKAEEMIRRSILGMKKKAVKSVT